MIDEPEICEIDDCENSAQVTISEEKSTVQMHVCHECVKITMEISNESVDIN